MGLAMSAPSPLDDPATAAHAWARFKRILRWMALAALAVILIAFALLYAKEGFVSIHLYIAAALGIGLLISSAVKNQLVASQLSMLATFMPAFMLSGFLFDLRSMPAAVRIITYALPARYYVALLQTVFLAGDVWSVILPNAAVLLVMAVVLFALSRAVTRKSLA